MFLSYKLNTTHVTYSITKSDGNFTHNCTTPYGVNALGLNPSLLISQGYYSFSTLTWTQQFISIANLIVWFDDSQPTYAPFRNPATAWFMINFQLVKPGILGLISNFNLEPNSNLYSSSKFGSLLFYKRFVFKVYRKLYRIKHDTN
jgi:hypothetical protein